MTQALYAAACEVIDTADATGCSDDLIVIERRAYQNLKNALEAGGKDTILASCEEIKKARDLYACDEIEVDDFAYVSRGFGTCWVQAWLFVNKDGEELLT